MPSHPTIVDRIHDVDSCRRRRLPATSLAVIHQAFLVCLLLLCMKSHVAFGGDTSIVSAPSPLTDLPALQINCSARASSAMVAQFGVQTLLHIYFTSSSPSNADLGDALELLLDNSCLPPRAFHYDVAWGNRQQTLVVWLSSSTPYSAVERMAYLAFHVYPQQAPAWRVQYNIDRIVPATIGPGNYIIDAFSNGENDDSSTLRTVVIVCLSVVAVTSTGAGAFCLYVFCSRRSRRVASTPIVEVDRVRVALPSEVNPDHVVVAVAADGDGEAPLPPMSIVDGVACFGIPDTSYGPQLLTARAEYLPRTAGTSEDNHSCELEVIVGGAGGIKHDGIKADYDEDEDGAFHPGSSSHHNNYNITSSSAATTRESETDSRVSTTMSAMVSSPRREAWINCTPLQH